MAFGIRVRGERQIFRHVFQALYEQNPPYTRAFIPLIPKYGCWRDIYYMMRNGDLDPALRQDLLDYILVQLAVAEPGAAVGVHLPRENRQREVAGLIAERLYPNERYSTRMKLYRQLVARLNPPSALNPPSRLNPPLPSLVE